MARELSKSPITQDTLPQRLFAVAFGVLLGLSFLKFGNPTLMDYLVTVPTNIFEWMLTAWPIAVGHTLLVIVVVLGTAAVRPRPGVSLWLVLAPLPWLAWQLVAAMASVDMSLTTPTLIHFLTNVVCYYLGLFCLSPMRELQWFWRGLLGGFVIVLLSGWQQHFGGLAATKAYFFNELYPQLNGEVPEALMKRMSSDRIFATLFYPNTLAGTILLLLPVSIGVLPEVFRQTVTRRLGLMLALGLATGCLWWSGSKAGWLLMMGLGLVALFRLRFSRTLKVAIAVVVLTAGLGGFVWKYSGYLQKGAQSAVARLDYWEAALVVTRNHPITGTGPGTFGKLYAEVKRPESEMARLTHNDFLQQACDSGVPGFVLFAGFICCTMTQAGRRAWVAPGWRRFWVWLGVLGITLQSLVEFGWYIPASSWPTMALLGWLIGKTPNPLDKPKEPNLSSGRI